MLQNEFIELFVTDQQQHQHKKFQNNLSSIYDTISTKRYQFINRFAKTKNTIAQSPMWVTNTDIIMVQIEELFCCLWWIVETQKHPQLNYVIMQLWWDEGESGEPCQDRNHQDLHHHHHVCQTRLDDHHHQTSVQLFSEHLAGARVIVISGCIDIAS